MRRMNPKPPLPRDLGPMWLDLSHVIARGAMPVDEAVKDMQSQASSIGTGL